MGKIGHNWPRPPRPLTEALTGLAAGLSFAALRIGLNPIAGETAPFALAILAMVLATLVAGWRSGLVAVVVAILLDWAFVVQPHGSFALPPNEASSFGFTFAAGALILLVLALHQREMRAAEVARTRRTAFLGHALREMDHRTRNNFQIVVSLLQIQAHRSGSTEAKAALGEAVERLQAISSVYDSLSLSHHDIGSVRLQDQLQQICDRVRDGLLPEQVALETELEPMLVPHETGACIGIVVNELVTNACKHAFPDRSGRILVSARRDGAQALITVSDDGCGTPKGSARKRRGLGTRLVAGFVHKLRGRIEMQSSEAGTVHTLTVPLQ